MKESYEKKIQILEKRNTALQEKIQIQNQLFPLVSLRDTKPSSVLYQLGDNIKKQKFSAIVYKDEETPRLLNSLAKVFAVSVPYSAIGLDQKNLYVSLSGAKIDISAMYVAAQDLINTNLADESCIPIIANFYQVLERNENQYVKKILDIKKLHYAKLKKAETTLYEYAAEDESIFYKYFSKQDINNIKKLNISDFKFSQIMPKEDELHIHVELNLVEVMREKNSGIKEINLGLAISDIRDDPGSCGYCSAALDAFSQENSIKISRYMDFKQNIPRGHWDFPHKLLNTTGSNFLFFQNLYKQYIPIVKLGLGHKQAFLALEDTIKKFAPSFEILIKINAEIDNTEQSLSKFHNTEETTEEILKETENYEESLKYTKPVQGFYSNDDVNILIEALLKEKGIFLDGNTREVTSENETQTLKTYILEARSLNTNNIASIKKEDYLHDLARDVGKILLNEGIKQILIPIRLENEQHWVTAQLNISQENKISAFIYDSAYRGKCLHNDIIYELSELFNKKDQLNIIFKDQLKATTFREEQSKKLVEIIEKFEIQEANVEKIQNPTGTKLINVYCGGYAAHLTANLAISQNPAWGYLDSIDSNQRLDDAILVNQYLPLQAKSFAKEGDNFESKKISQQKDHQRLELANQYFDSKKENLNKVLEENEANFDELFKFLNSYDKGTIFKPGTVINHQQLLSHLRNLPQEVESNFNFLKLDQTDRVFNDALTPEQIVYVLLCLKDQLQIKGNNPIQTGLNISDIKINLNTIIKANQDNTDFDISPKIMEQEELLSSLSDWQTIPHSHYSALIKLENESGDKHAVLFYASKEAGHLAITITDPLSQEASTFKLRIANLADSLHEEGRTIQVIYSGRQDKDYGTCADMSLIMLQELIEQTAKPMLDNHNQTTVNNFINNNHITYENSMIHKFDYDNYQSDLLGHHDVV